MGHGVKLEQGPQDEGPQDPGTWDPGLPLKFKSGLGTPLKLKVGPQDANQSLKVGPREPRQYVKIGPI